MYKLSVNHQHQDYEKTFPFWEKLRHCIEGEDKIKQEGNQYLPVPPGLRKTSTSPEYINYKERARFPEMVGPAIEGMVGLMGRKINEPEVPEQLKYLYEEATPDGLSLSELQNRLRHEVSSVGRYCLFVDVNEDGGNPYIATYPAESIINWRGDAERLTLIVFYETVDVPAEDDYFVTTTEDRWREASVEVDEETGIERYVVRLWKKVEFKDEQGQTIEAFDLAEEPVYPTMRGENLKFVPAVIIGSRDLLPEPDAVPLLGVANKSLHYYRQYADYAMQLCMSANGTTPYIFGVPDGQAPSTIGPTEIWHSESAEATAGYIEIQGAGLTAQKQELDNIKDEIAYATVRVLGDKKAAEAAETLRLRFQSQTATLSSISNSCATGLRKALRFCAMWIGADEDKVDVQATTEFISEEPDPQLIQTLYDGIEKGFIPEDLLIHYTRRTELHDMDEDQFKLWAPFFAARPPEDEG